MYACRSCVCKYVKNLEMVKKYNPATNVKKTVAFTLKWVLLTAGIINIVQL